MNLSKSSLIYKLWDFHNNTYHLNTGKVSLCTLFWTTVGYILRDLAVIAFVLAVVALPGPFLLEFVGLISTTAGFAVAGHPWWMFALAFLGGAVFWAGVIAALFAIFWPLTKLGSWIKDKWEDREFVRELKMEMARDEKLRIGNMYQKFKIAKKEKLCPIIRVVDNE